MKSLTNFSQLFYGDRAYTLDGREKNSNRLLRTLKIFSERSVIHASAISVLSPNGLRPRSIDILNDRYSYHGCSRSSCVYP